MKRFIGFIKKEFYHIFRDRRSLFILFGMPIAQIMLFGFAITNEINNVNIAILDHSKDETTQEIIHKIESSKYFTITASILNETEIETAFKKGHVKAVLIFEKDFSKNLGKENNATVQVIADATDPNTANTISNYVSAILQNYQQQINVAVKTPYQIAPKTRMVFNPEESIDFNGNTGPFIQYTYARIQSIMRKSENPPETFVIKEAVADEEWQNVRLTAKRILSEIQQVFD